jgi:hypothetical protein
VDEVEEKYGIGKWRSSEWIRHSKENIFIIVRVQWSNCGHNGEGVASNDINSDGRIQ